MASDIEIAQNHAEAINQVASARHPGEHLEPYGHYKAKYRLRTPKAREPTDGKLILVTCDQSHAGRRGKTTTTVGLGDALNRSTEKAIICLREPSLSPVFGMKGGAAGGRYAQVVRWRTSTFTSPATSTRSRWRQPAAALLDNHPSRQRARHRRAAISWKRVVDMNDRALHEIVVARPGNGFPRQDSFDIVVASESWRSSASRRR
jgi:formate--tetrahydrofolate ligase